jgi:membrane-bound ClpP family serine protease
MGGTARAGKLYRENGGRKIWPTAAMLATMLLLMDSFYFFLGTRGILVEHVRMVFTGRYGAPASMSVVKNGTDLQLTGTLYEGSADAFAGAIHDAPTVTVFDLDSKGGILQEALLLAESVSQRGLDTYVSRECSSACTFVFLAGRHRCLARGARIGFHAASYVHDLSRKTFEDIAALERDQYLKAGLAEPFISEIMETPNSRAWYPSREELREAHVTTEGCP